ncbi:hypothetical protein, partial [Adlercreutzia sp. CNCM I-6215]
AAVPIYLTQGTKPADWRYQILLIVGTGEGYYSSKANMMNENSGKRYRKESRLRAEQQAYSI